MPWATQGRVTNPGVASVLADTGPLSSGTSYSPHIVMTSTVAMQLLLQRRDTANTATLQEHIFPIAANQPFSLPIQGVIDIADGERLRLIPNAAATGVAQGSIFW